MHLIENNNYIKDTRLPGSKNEMMLSLWKSINYVNDILQFGIV